MSPYRTSARPETARRSWIRRLAAWLLGWGVRTVYGLPPDYDARGINDEEGRE